MNKTSVYLALDDTRRLAELAQREGISQAEVIRRAIKSYSTAQRPRDRDFALARAGSGPGDSVADLADADLLEGFGS